MPHLVKLQFFDFPAYFWLGELRPSLPNPAVNERTMASDYFSKHVVRAFGQRVKEHTHGFHSDDLSACSTIAFCEMIGAVFAFVTLFLANLSAFNNVVGLAFFTW